MRRAAGWAVGLVLLAWGILLIAWGVLHWAILPHINDWRPAIEQQASAALGVKLRIGAIEVRSGGWIPALALRDVRLLDPAGREALRLPQVSAALSARSLLALELRFEQLLVEAPELEIRRDAQGRIYIAGLSVDQAEHAEASGAADAWIDWLFAQHEFAILNGRVRWIDERRAAPPLELSGVDLLLRNGLRSHQLRLDAVPPPAWGDRFTLRGRFTQSLLRRASELRYWNGQLYADLPRTDVRELRRHVDLPFELSEGDGALRAWVDVRDGKAVGAILDMGLRAVKLRVSKQDEPLELARIEGRLALQRQPQSLALTATQLGFVGADGLQWPRSNWGVQLRLAPARPGRPDAGDEPELAGGELRAERLDLALMAQIAERLPIGEAPRHLLAELAPRGVVSALNARWDGALDAPRSYLLKAQLDGLEIAARPAAQPGRVGRPGVHGANFSVEASEKGGQVHLRMNNGTLEFPGVFETPQLALQQLRGTLGWRIEARAGLPPLVELRIADLVLANADLQASFDGTWRTGAGSGTGSGGRWPGLLDLSGRIERAEAARVADYLPLAVGANARDYVRHALLGGQGRQASVKVHGDLADFPFENPQSARNGQFRIALQAQDVQLAYVPSYPATASAPAYASPWPVMDKVNAELVFERGGMAIRNGRARVLGYELQGVNGGIKDMTHDHPVLELDGNGRGPLAELLRFMRSSPVGDWTGGALNAASASGPAQLKLGLQLPLEDVSRATVKGAVLLAGNDLRLRPDTPLLAGAKARVEFDRKGVTVQAGSARVLGGDATFDGGTQKDGSLRFNGSGLVTAEALRRAGELGLVARLAASMNGQTTYKLQLGINQGQTELAITSNLQGLALDLPAPLRKEAEGLLPLRYQTSLLPGSTREAPRDELRFELGNQLQLHYQRDLGVEPARVLRGAIGVLDGLPALPAGAGVQMQANLGSVNLDAWQALLARWQGGGAAGVDMLEGGPYAPTQIALRAQNLTLNGRPLTRLVAGVSRGSGPEQNSWRATLDAEQLSGFVELRPARASQAGRVYARLARLSLPKSEAESVSQLLEQQPSSLPALDIVVDDFELRGKHLGRLEVEAQLQGATREWRLTRLQLRHPDAVLNATGQWLAEPGQALRRAQMDWKLDVADAGNLLERLGQGRVLRGGKGQLAGQVSWRGSPLAPDYPSMSGQLSVALDAGQFLKAEPGVGRLLGVLSLQSLPRRFLLDFRDVFQEGFAFDGIGGDVTIAHGVATSHNLRMRGVQATVAMEGHTDLAAETQDLRVVVVPEVNAGGASLAYLAINPAVGLTTFLAQLLLRKPMAAAGTSEFHVTGSWEDPKVDKVERQAEEPAAAAAGGAGAASAP